ncbi:putative DNA-damage inducible protein DDI1-like protein [Trypanosoma theileri]|uniref:Putative DNA-damage inducible protein DDI1-like protein n=1 Tax=Trypanosoma theileri TaxID=67003 RepID=A0A1X0P3M6_9TRYP|nr:putative DNA-damage inducible protein DDI1-like protein [Trypanosoma theileri]ORC91527.1 putative DNA-damage inducible protein DDI1-like protein [Trypanosoma theileri]
MFVLPVMQTTPEGSQPLEKVPTQITPSDIQLPVALLSHWGLPFYSELPEEGVARTELMEEYLIGLTRLVRMRNALFNEAYDNALQVLVRDETVEREFIEEDSNALVWWSFIEYTSEEARRVLERREETERLRIIDAFFVSALSDMSHFETIHRQHVATQFLDSCFLKLCQVKPGWMWRRVPPVLDDEDSSIPRTVRAPLWVGELSAEESEARKRITNNFFSGFSLILEVFTTTEKRLMHSNHVKDFQSYVVPLSEMEKKATLIQATFRGYRVRQRIAVAG